MSRLPGIGIASGRGAEIAGVARSPLSRRTWLSARRLHTIRTQQPISHTVTRREALMLGPGELLIILLVLLLFFGSRRLPDLARSVGTSMKELRKGLEGEDAEHDERAG